MCHYSIDLAGKDGVHESLLELFYFLELIEFIKFKILHHVLNFLLLLFEFLMHDVYMFDELRRELLPLSPELLFGKHLIQKALLLNNAVGVGFLEGSDFIDSCLVLPGEHI